MVHAAPRSQRFYLEAPSYTVYLGFTMTIIRAHIASDVELLQRAVVVRLVPLVADQIAVRHGPLVAVHSAAQSAPPSVQRTAASSGRAHGQGRGAVRPVARVHPTLLRKRQALLRLTGMWTVTEALCVFLHSLMRQLTGDAVTMRKEGVR